MLGLHGAKLKKCSRDNFKNFLLLAPELFFSVPGTGYFKSAPILFSRYLGNCLSDFRETLPTGPDFCEGSAPSDDAN
jgi:hypothetical protein